MPNRAQQPAVVKPVHVTERRELDVVDATPGPTLYLDDGVAACSTWIPGCTPGSRDHHTLVEFNTVGRPTCALSGVLFESGLDLDDDGVLDPGEVAMSQTVCDPPLASCAAILAVAPSSTDGVYTIAPGGVPTEAYCDMTNGGYSYLELGMGQWDQSYPGFTFLPVSELQKPTVQEFFIWAYNKQGGANVISSWSAGDCCFRNDGSTVVNFGGEALCPSDGAGGFEWFYTAPTYPMRKFPSFIDFPTLADSFFTANPVTTGTQCSNSQNPGFFARVLAP